MRLSRELVHVEEDQTVISNWPPLGLTLKVRRRLLTAEVVVEELVTAETIRSRVRVTATPKDR